MSWFCIECETENQDSVQVCEVCGARRIDEKEESFWAEVQAGDTLKMYGDYLDRYPEGRYVTKAKNKIRYAKAKESKCFNAAEAAGTSDGYSEYLVKYPDGKYVQEAQRKLEELQRYDNDSWSNACSEDTIESYTKYLHNFPSGAYVAEAKGKIDEEMWRFAEKADTADSYNDYLKNYPYGRFAAIARGRVKQIEAEAKCWYKAVTVNTVDSYNAYLKKYPLGKHEDEAKKRLGELAERIKRRRQIRRVVAAVFCAGMLILSVSVGPSAVRYVSRYVQTEFVKGKSPAKAGQQQNVSALEKETQEKIDGLKLGKRKGWTENADYKRQVEDNLEKLNQLGSARYNELRKEYESL